MSARNKKKKKFAAYVLLWKPGTRIDIIEAKENKHMVSHGLQQALGYAEILGVPSAFSSNGDDFKKSMYSLPSVILKRKN
ncbi:MAG: hypothetical protein U0W24_22285 [Bacteroidales bacterium]